MTALVPELVNMASDSTVATTDLLRRALVAANRLNLPEISKWVKSELNGYDEDIPNYRTIYGYLMAEHPYNGLIPYLIPDSKALDTITRHQEVQSIPELERILQGAKNGLFVRYFSPEKEAFLMKGMTFKMRPQLQFSPAQIKGIVEKVRNRILEWALELEGSGILGEGLAFTQKEKQMVQELHYHNHFNNVNDSLIQVASNGSTQHQANHLVGNKDALKVVADALAKAVDRSELSNDVVDELRAEIATLKAQAASPKPKWEIVKASAKSVKAIVEGAAGSVLGELAKPHIQALLALLPS